MVTVPPQFDPLVREMSQSTGIPYDIIAAQADVESGFKASAQSSAGALGWLQFLPSTYNDNAQAAGVPPNSEFNIADEAKVYDVFMGGLLKQEHGNIRDALAAYNAGPGNIQAGMPYADKILGMAGNPGGGGGIITTGFPNPLGGLTGGLSISGILGNVFGDLRDILERFGLILLGAALILLGIHILANSGGTVGNAASSAQGAAADKVKGSAAKSGASEAAEAAIVA